MQTNNNFNLIDNLLEREEEIGNLEKILAKGLYQPFNSANSGSRKLLHGSQLEQVVQVKDAQMASITTGYEIQYGDYNSSKVVAENEYEVVAIISKFSFNPKLVYYTILADHKNKKFKIFETRKFEYTNETYGYEYNTSHMDCLEEGYVIPNGYIMRTSKSYDEFQNRQDGLEANCVYYNTEKNKEDSIIISESFSERAATSKLAYPKLMINSNDIPLNLYGNRSEYKSFPDVGEEVENCILCAVRRERNDEMEYTHTYEMLSKTIMSDDKITVNGYVYDIDIYVNDPENIKENIYNTQLYKYYMESIRFRSTLLNTVDNLKLQYPDYELDYDLDKMYYTFNELSKGAKYTKDRGKEFANISIEFHIVEFAPLSIGDKITNRYGGKGVVSHIYPDVLMPYNPETREYADIVINSDGCTNRENPGQIFEIHLNSASTQIVNMIYKLNLDNDTIIKWIYDFYHILSPKLATDFMNKISNYWESTEEMIDIYIQSIIDEGRISIALEPISECVNIDTLDRIYKQFPFIHDPYLYVPVQCSNGKYRRVKTKRPIPFGSIYMYRLKQHSEDKFSATSLSATNIRGLNTKSKANKEYRSMHGKTPIQFGYMESGDIANLGMEYLVEILMIHAVSPSAIELMEKALTGDPYNIDIKLDENSSNRNVEILNAYLTTCGLEFVFNKIRKNPQFAMRKITDSENYRDFITATQPFRKTYRKILSEEYLKQFDKEREFARNSEIPFAMLPFNHHLEKEIEELKEFGER